MEVPKELKYTKTHEWIRIEGEEAIMGITDFAQKEMGDIVFAELPQVGVRLEKGKESGVIESVKAASDIYAPLTGEVSRINDLLESDASMINQDPYGKGWFYSLKGVDQSMLDELMDAEQYEKLISGSAG